MINSISNLDKTIVNSSKKTTLQDNDNKGFDKTLINLPGGQGLKKKYKYDEMTDTEKRLFNSYRLQKMLLSSSKDMDNYTYEDYQKAVRCFPPASAPRSVFKAWESFLSKYPENDQLKIAAQFLPSAMEKEYTSDAESFVKELIDHCSLDEIITGTNRFYEKSLYNNFLKELEKFS